MTADYVVTKLKKKTGNEAFFKHLINSCKKNNKFSEEMAKIRFVWVGKIWEKLKIKTKKIAIIGFKKETMKQGKL